MKMMKWITFWMMNLLLASCSALIEEDEMAALCVAPNDTVPQLEIARNQFNEWIQEARWGHGHAFLQLANCYLDGVGVPRDLSTMQYMVVQAIRTGALPNSEAYGATIPDNHDFKPCYDLMLRHCMDHIATDDSLRSYMSNSPNPEVRALYAGYLLETEEKEKGYALLEEAAHAGGTLAQLLLHVRSWEEVYQFDPDYIEPIAKKSPILYLLIAQHYLEKRYYDERLAACYYLKADAYALLGQEEADWLLAYHHAGGDLSLPFRDMRRLESLVRIH